jgi:hypothetical protein
METDTDRTIDAWASWHPDHAAYTNSIGSMRGTYVVHNSEGAFALFREKVDVFLGLVHVR